MSGDEPDMVYYNTSIINNKTDGAVLNDPYIYMNETRDSPIVRNSSDYYFSIVRFTMNGPNKDLPIFIPSIQTGIDQSNVNLTNYSIVLSSQCIDPNNTSQYLTITSGEVFLEFEPEHGQLKNYTPQPPFVRQEASKYYFVYTYNHVVDLVNKTIRVAGDKLNEEYKKIYPSHDLPILLPVLQYNGEQENNFSLFFDIRGVQESAPATQKLKTLDLYMNQNMWGLFGSFQSLYDPDVGMYRVIVKKYGIGKNIVKETNVDETAATVTFYEIKQDYEATSSLWCPIDAVVFTSTVIPIHHELIGEPHYTDDATNVGTASGSRNAFQPIITDISLPMTNAHAYRSLLYYAPNAQYRLADFSSSNQPIHSVDMQVAFRNRLDGALYPISMFNLSSVSVKVLFQKK